MDEVKLFEPEDEVVALEGDTEVVEAKKVVEAEVTDAEVAKVEEVVTLDLEAFRMALQQAEVDALEGQQVEQAAA
jgi:hypothetical protein